SSNCTATATATTITTTTTTTTTITTTNSIGENCQALRDELTRVKLGLGIGLGSGMVITSSMAVGFYVYFAKRFNHILEPYLNQISSLSDQMFYCIQLTSIFTEQNKLTQWNIYNQQSSNNICDNILSIIQRQIHMPSSSISQ
ncbi:unnamed protein product, partial [Rotaria sp. Silwood2]